jgi:hypothetical protein
VVLWKEATLIVLVILVNKQANRHPSTILALTDGAFTLVMGIQGGEPNIENGRSSGKRTIRRLILGEIPSLVPSTFSAK